MSLKSLFNADAGLSMLFHALKAVAALLVNWIVLRHFAVQDFVVWSVTSSILIVATTTDLGIGQYAITRMINSDRTEWPLHVGRSLGALVPLALLSALFVFVAVDGPSTLYRVTMAALLSARLLTIPFYAVLHAANQFKIRKALELGAYIAALFLVGAIALTNRDIHLALVALNAMFLVGFLLMAVAAARYMSPRAAFRAVSLRHSMQVFRSSVPFLVNNLTGLLTYGGFIWLGSLALPEGQVAKLAVLHTFVLMNLYQFYDVFLRARQADLADVSRLASFYRLNLLVLLSVPVAFLLAGREALALIGSPLEITTVEAALFGVFMSLELGNLFAQSVAQVNLSSVSRLKSYSAMRAAMLGAFAIAGLLPISGNDAFLILLSLLVAGSLVTFIYLVRGVRDAGSADRTTTAATLLSREASDL